MIILKVIRTAIDIRDCLGLYTDSSNLLRLLVARYEGRCYAGCYIKQVRRIIRQGQCMISLDGPPTTGTIAVTFEVQAVYFAADEVIVGAVVKSRDPRGIICGTDITSIIVAHHALLESITPGMIIPVQVGEARYTCNDDKVSISGFLYLPVTRPLTFAVGAAPRSNKNNQTAGVLSKIAREESARAELILSNANAVKMFDTLLHAYKTGPAASEAGSEIILSSLVGPTGAISIPAGVGWLSRDPRADPARPVVTGYTTRPDHPVIEGVPAADAVTALLENYCAYLRMSREMVEAYPTPELIKQHASLWKIFGKNKADAHARGSTHT